MKRIYIILFGCFVAVVQALAMTPEEAKQAYNRGDYYDAAPTLKELADKAPKNATANTMAGVALAKIGNIMEAKRYLARGSNEAKITLAEIAFDEYKFDEAEEWLDKYAAAQKKARKPVSQAAEALLEKIGTMSAMLDRVEKIVIIDSIAVPKATFFEAYHLSQAAGSIQGAANLPKSFYALEGSTYFTSDNNSTIIWCAEAGNGSQLAQTWALTDGSWEDPMLLGTGLNEGGAVGFPFLMSDGVTLYFANNGENSIGGYDIFISRYDGEKFLQPQNIGMPYNSPFDDYMLAIDEETGIGWWATDRNQLDEYITIYKFIPQELRINYPADTENLPALARVAAYKATWQQGKDYSELIRRSNTPEEWEEALAPGLLISLPDGRKVSPDKLRSPQARTQASQYSAMLSKLKNKETVLARMRADYAKGNKSLAGSISDAEAEVDTLISELKMLRNKIVSAETQNK